MNAVDIVIVRSRTLIPELCDALETAIAERDTYKSALQNWHEDLHNTEPIKHGKWIEWDDEWFHGIKCSECGEKRCCKNVETGKTNFCPNCGAKLKEGKH